MTGARSLAIAAAAALALLPLTAALSDDSDNNQSVLVTMTPLKEGGLPMHVTGYGTVMADPSARNSVNAPLAAVIGKVYVRPGEEIDKGAPLIELVPNPQTASSYTQAVSAVRNSEAMVAHTEQLYRLNLATKQALADAKKGESDAEAALKALTTQGAGGARTLTAPFRAVVTNLAVSSGSTVDVGTSLLDLAPPENLVLQIGVVPDRATEVMPGNPVKIVPVGSAETIEGKVVLRGSIVESGNGLVPVDISLPPGKLLPGQTAEATITTGTVNGYVVPHAAILVDDQGEPYVVQAVKMKAKIVHVTVLNMDGDRDTIQGKLDKSAPLVLAGNYQLSDGMQIRLPSQGSAGGR